MTSGGQSDPSAWAQYILSGVGDAIVGIDVSGRITYLNLAAERMTGWSVKEALGLPMAEVIKTIDVSASRPSHRLTEPLIDWDVAADHSTRCVLIHRDGTKTVTEGSVTLIDNQQGRHAGKVLVFHTPLEEARPNALSMSGLAHYDCLTDLPNRALLKDRLDHALALATRHKRASAVLYLDLDHFKDINDCAGHAIGDRVLQSIGRRLLACVRNSDTVCRYGGDEFVVLLSEVNGSRSLLPVAEKILSAIAVPHDLLTPHVIHVTASAGVSIFPSGGRDGDTLIQSAEAAMHFAKQRGGNAVQSFDVRLRA